LGAGLRTTVQPAAITGSILHVTIVARKFQGVIAATTPIGCLITQNCLDGEGLLKHSLIVFSSNGYPFTKVLPNY